MNLKFTNCFYFSPKRLLKVIIKSFVLLFCSIVLNLNAHSVNSQNDSINIDANKNISLENVFTLIKKHTDYQFVYDVNMIKDAPNISLKEGSITVKALLDLGLSPINCVYEFLDNTIIVKMKVQDQVTNEIDQQFSVSGLVEDEAGRPVPGASVFIEGTTFGTVADFDGNYSVNASLSDGSYQLIVSNIGFATQNIEFQIENNDQIEINVILQQDILGLDEVVVVGSTGGVNKRTLGNAVTTVRSEDLVNNAAIAVDQALSRKFVSLKYISL